MYDIILFTEITETIPVYKAIGAYKLAYELRRNGFTCLVVDRFHTFNIVELKQILDKAIGSNTLFVGVSTTFLQNSNIPREIDKPLEFGQLPTDTFLPHGKEVEKEFVDYIKTKNSKTKIVLGGTRVHGNYSNKRANYVILGYAEFSIVNLANHLRKGDDLKNATKNIWGVYIIDDKVASEYDFASSQMSWDKLDVLNFKVLPLEMSRGCIFKCRFCSHPLIGKKNLDYVRSEDHLRYELERNYYEYGVDTYTLLDDTFNDNTPKLLRLLDVVKKLPFQPKFWGYNRLDLIAKHPETIDILYDIGIRAVSFGIETLNRETGLIIGKGYDKRKQIETVQLIRSKYNNEISLHGTFIIGAPKESKESIKNTFNFLMTEELPLHTWRFIALTILKNELVAWNSEIGRDYKKFGYKELPSDNPTRFDINWENEHMNREYAYRTEEEYNSISHAHPKFFTPNILGWGLLNLGVPLEQLTTVRYQDLDWVNLEKKKDEFNIQHKKELFKTLGIQLPD